MRDSPEPPHTSPTSPNDRSEIDPECLADHGFEDSLEPHHLIRRSDTVLRAGILMLGAGTSSLRVRELMRRAAAALGLDDVQAEIGFTHIATTVQRGSIFRTQVAEIGNPGVNAHRIELLQRLSLGMPDRTTATELDRKLDRIERTPPLYPTWLLAMLVAVACGATTVLTGGGWREVAAVLPSSALAFWAQRRLTRWQVNHLAIVLVAAVMASAGYLGCTAVLNAALGDTSPHLAAGFICASIFLIPGFPLVTGGLDLTRLDLNAGIPRVAYAAMVLLAITIGVWVVATLGGVSADVAPPSDLPGWALWTTRVVASFAAVFGWAMAFNSPVRVAAASGAIAVLGNTPRLLMLDAGVPNHVATFIGCVIIGLACAALGRAFRLEKIIMTVPTLLVSIPGSSALQTLLYFDQADIVLAMGHAVSTLLVVIAMVAGLGTARMLTDPEWAFTRPGAPSLASVVRRQARRVTDRR